MILNDSTTWKKLTILWRLNDIRRICLLVAWGLIVWSTVGIVTSSAQGDLRNRQPSPQEYIRSTSPLADGGMIVSQSDRGGNVQTVTMIASLPIANQSPSVGFQSNPSLQAGVIGSPVAMTANYPASGFNDGRFNQGMGGSYVYPAANQQPTNTLGFEPVGPVGNRGGIFQRNRPIIPTVYSEPPMQSQLQSPPTILGTTVPGTSDTFAMPNQMPFQQAPQPAWNGQASWMGSGNTMPAVQTNNRVQYAPLISLRNLPPGTYVGQGIIGQPKAYVDGEPIRNLLRYIFP